MRERNFPSTTRPTEAILQQYIRNKSKSSQVLPHRLGEEAFFTSSWRSLSCKSALGSNYSAYRCRRVPEKMNWRRDTRLR